MTLYAAYGSNLDPARMGERCPHSPLQTTGWLEGWRLTFGGEEHGWDGALATIVQDPFEQVFVAVYDVTPEDEAALDGWESVDTGLFRKTKVRVSTLSGESRAHALESLSGQERGHQLRHSIAGRIGHVIEPVIAPLGFDWRIGVGILGAFAAREVFVSTMGIVFDIKDADEQNQPLRDALRSATRSDGSQLMTPLTGIALMVFFVLACQCMSTLAVVRRESGSWKWPLFMFGYQTLLAYVAALVVFQTGRLLGLA